MGTNETRDGHATAPATTSASPTTSPTGGSPTGAAPSAAQASPASPRRRRGPDRRSADGRVSDRRAAANRANAQRSTGPRTARGKKIARLNALVHGLAAQTSLLPGEDDVELAKLTAEFEADHGCGSAAERAVAGRMVSVVWKLRRLARAEEHAADELQTKHAYAWGARRARLGIPLPADGYGFGGPDPMPMPSDAPQIVAEELGREVKPGAIERLMIWDVRLGGELMAASRQLANLRRAMGTAHEERGCEEPLAGLTLAEDGDDIDVESEGEDDFDVESDVDVEGYREDVADEDGDGDASGGERVVAPSRTDEHGVDAAPPDVSPRPGVAPSSDAPPATRPLLEPVPATGTAPYAPASSEAPATSVAEVALAAIPPAAAPDRTHCPWRPRPMPIGDRGRAGW